MKTVYEVIEAVANTSSRNEKISILESVKGKEVEGLLVSIIGYAYSPYYVFNVKKIKMPDRYKGSRSLESALEILPLLYGRTYTGKAAANLITETLGELSEQDADILCRILKKDLRCGATASSFNKVWDGVVYDHPYMRATAGSKKTLKKLKYPCISETKMDGMYVDILVTPDKVNYMSRQGQYLPFGRSDRDAELIAASGIIANQYPSGYVLMGEALVLGENGSYLSRQEGNGYLNSDDADPAKIVFVVWDCVPYDHFLNKKSNLVGRVRRDAASAIASTVSFVKEVNRTVCNTIGDVVSALRTALKNGEEGIIAKNMDILWQNGTSTDQFKIKCIAECELRVVGFSEGDGKYKGAVGSLTCRSLCNKVRVNVSGFTDELRSIWYKNPSLIVNKIITVRYNDLVGRENASTMSLYLPRFVEIRKDKQEPDALHQIEAQLDACIDAVEMMLRC